MDDEQDKYGEVLEEVMVLEDSYTPVRIALVQQYGHVWLDIRKMHKRTDGELRHGKGLRIEVDEGSAEDVILAAQSLLMGYIGEDE